MNRIPEVINNYNVYNKENILVGVSGEVELPDIESITDTIEGAGILGEIEDAVTGQFSSMKLKIPFAIIYTSIFDIMDTTTGANITLRGSMQEMDRKTGETDYTPVRIIARGKTNTAKLGKFVKGKKTESEAELEIFYLKIEIDGNNCFELDKLNSVFVLNGKDMLAKIRQQIN